MRYNLTIDYLPTQFAMTEVVFAHGLFVRYLCHINIFVPRIFRRLDSFCSLLDLFANKNANNSVNEKQRKAAQTKTSDKCADKPVQ